jgi:hypothetical protein
MGAIKPHDSYAWNLGIDHSQWIQWLNRSNTFTISAQQFWFRALGVHNTFKPGLPPGLLNDADLLSIRPRNAAPTGPNPTAQEKARPGGVGQRTSPCIPGPGGVTPCIYKALVPFPAATQITTLSISTQYLTGNLRPSVTFFYDWGGAWLVQPGVDWIFQRSLRLSVRYNYLDGRYTGIGFFNTKDNIWVELQYLLY